MFEADVPGRLLVCSHDFCRLLCRFTKIRTSKFRPYELLYCRAYPRVGLSSERELAHPNTHENALTKTETNEGNVSQSVRLTFCFGVRLL
jgi:hypothetical protein